jgi:hypothetical protein
MMLYFMLQDVLDINSMAVLQVRLARTAQAKTLAIVRAAALEDTPLPEDISVQ